ncbi:neoverrucotoxin subunit alpha-like [Embiotoca jacksoni]|uniref:neoverrucotoxin subunit alpha-like n=1 Tax=Embiotoca jacksoni TaxID=100190 RepID=UPI0037047B76
MDSESIDPLEVPALGRDFSLGMLYDCRYDALVTEPTVWSPDELTEHVGERSQAYNDIEIVASDSIDEKSSALNVDASVKASLLFGLFKGKGSAKFLDDRKKSKNQARVTLNYKVTTKVKELSINRLIRQNKKYSEVIDKGLATHVVTAILYGAQTFFVFDHKVSEEENNEHIQCKLKLFAKNIFSHEVNNEYTVDDKKVSCTFHGDIHPEKLPTSFKEAIEVYQGLPKLLGPNGEKAVPIKVWLLPLASLDPSAAKLVRQISVGFVQECQSVLEDFNEIEMRWNDAINTTAADGFPQVKEKIEAFKKSCSDFKVKFQETLVKTLPSIRKGQEGESELANILTMIHSSPFNIKSLSEWMDRKEREIYTVMCFTKMMKNTETIPLQDQLHKEICSPDHVVCFVFTSLGRAEPYLSALSDYLKRTTKPDDPQDPHTDYVEKEPWYASADIAETKKRAELFSDFAQANEENKNIKFLTVGLTNETQKGSTIYLYKDGRSVSENFEPPSKPETVTVDEINHNNVTLKISPPRFGKENVTSYSVEYCVSGEKVWQQKTESKAEEVTVSDLRPNTKYKFRCRAVTSAGVGPANEVSDSIKTLPCCPPGEPQVEANSCEISVSWKKPAELGEDVQISSYILEYAKTDNEVKEELKWKQKESKRESEIKSSAEKKTISGLKSKTEYAVRKNVEGYIQDPRQFTNCV